MDEQGGDAMARTLSVLKRPFGHKVTWDQREPNS